MTDRSNPADRTWFLVNRGKVEGTAFFDEACYDYYLLRLFNCLRIFDVQLHAYVLLPREVWLLLTPVRPRNMSSLVDYVNNGYSEYFNERFERDADVFRSQPLSAIIDSAKLYMDAQKLIERWPLASGAVEHPGLYRWSSYSANAFGGRPQNLTRHRFFEQFIDDTESPMERYREFIAAPFGKRELARLEQRLLQFRR